jgi:hypothetical protein
LGTRERLTDMFGAAAATISIEPRFFNFRYRSPEHFLEMLKTYYGPMLNALATLERGTPASSITRASHPCNK